MIFSSSAVMPQSIQPRTPGYRFKDGRLMIFREDKVMLIRSWEEPSAVRKGDGNWQPFTPDFRLVAPYRRKVKKPSKRVAPPAPPAAAGQLEFDLLMGREFAPSNPTKPISLTEQRRKAFDSFRFSLPKEVARVLEPFRSHQWNLLVLLAHDKRVLDLAGTNPVLAYALADWYANNQRSRLDLGKMPQRDLLKLLKLPDSAALVKLFRKIPPESVDRHFWPTLLTGLRHSDGVVSKFLSHVTTINLGVMELIVRPQIRPAITPSLLAEVAAEPKEKYCGSVARMISDIMAMREELSDERPLTGITTIERIRHLHADVTEDFQKLGKMRRELGHMPPPPIPGLDGKIIPLEKQSALVAEGREQKNCVATYAASVVNRSCYIYKVMHPTRATLCIRRESDGNWGVSELEASCNRPVDKATHKFVQQWLEPYRLGI